MRYLTPTIPFLLISFVITLPAAEWTSFRGPAGDGSSSAKGLPLQWSATENISWKIPVAGQGWSSPVFHKGILYLTNAVSVDAASEKPAYELNTLAIEAQTGKTLWVSKIFTQPPDAPRIHTKNSHASPTPIVTDRRIYVHFGHLGTACLTLKGEVLWKALPAAYAPVHGNGGSPILIQDKLIFSVDGSTQTTVFCLNASNGNALWRFDRKSTASRKFSFSTPAVILVNGKPQVISPASDVVHSLDPDTGKLIWQVRYDGYSVIPKPVFHNGLLYVSTGYDTPWLYCIDPTGRGDVTSSHVRWSNQRQIPHTSSLIAVDGRIFMVSDRGIGSCLDALTGETIWQQRIGGNFSSSPVLNRGNIYFTSEQGTTTVIRATPEYELVSSNTMDQRVLSSITPADGVIFMRTQSHLYSIKE